MRISKKQVLVTSTALVVAGLTTWGLAAASDASATSGDQGAPTAVKSPDGRPTRSAEQERAAAVAKGATGASQDRDMLTEPSTVAPFAAALGVSEDAARTALASLAAISGGHGLEPRSPQFGAVADSLGVSAEQLAGAITSLKVGH